MKLLLPESAGTKPITVLPPASTPDADSTNVVTVEVPVTEPASVPTASEIKASFILGILPVASSILALDSVPTSVPIVSNMSMMQNVMMRVTTVNQPIWAKPAKSSLKRVVSAISLKGGRKDAVARLAKGFCPKIAKSPIQ